MSERTTSKGTLLGLPPAELAAKFFEQRPTPPAREDLIGKRLAGRYLVESMLGEGGMATVYRGLHETIRKPVAIKVLDPALYVPDAVERFLQEAQATSLVQHENVVELTDFGTTDDGVVFAVMELLLGETLESLLDREGALEPSRAVDIAQQICSGLQAAHDKGVVHRDLKPENCFRLPRTASPDFIKVLDFGIAKVGGEAKSNVTAAPRRTQVGVIVGTPEYMAPEQARAEACDARADVYSAGVILYRMLSGALPFDKPTPAEVLSQQMYETPPSLVESNPLLPRALCDVVARALEKEPDDRYPSMAAMSEALDEALHRVERERERVDTTERDVPALGAPRGRSRRGMAVAALGVVGLLSGGYFMTRAPAATVGPILGDFRVAGLVESAVRVEPET